MICHFIILMLNKYDAPINVKPRRKGGPRGMGKGQGEGTLIVVKPGDSNLICHFVIHAC